MKAILPVVLLLAGGLLAVVLSGCSAASLAGTRKEVAPAPAATPSLRTEPVVPPIDAIAARVVDVETATFALG